MALHAQLVLAELDHLSREYLVLISGTGIVETLLKLLDPVVDDIWKSKEAGCLHSLLFQ